MRVEGFEQVLHRPVLDGLHGLGDRAVSRQHEDGQAGPAADAFPQQLATGHAGHLLVGKDQIDLSALQLQERLFAVGGEDDRVPRRFQQVSHGQPEILVVIDDEYDAVDGHVLNPKDKAAAHSRMMRSLHGRVDT